MEIRSNSYTVETCVFFILYKDVFNGYLFNLYLKKNSVVHTENEVVQGD